MESCPSPDALRTPDDQVLAHLEACASCRERRALLEVIDAPESSALRRELDDVARSPGAVLGAAELRSGVRLSHGPRRVIAAVLSASVAAAAVGVVLLRPRDPGAVVAGLQGTTRPFEVALSDAPYAPYAPSRGGADEPRFDRALRQLLEAREKSRAGAERALAMLFLMRGGAGDAARVDDSLRRAGDSAEADNDRGVVAFVRGDYLAALELFHRALAKAPNDEAARFNHALALERLGLGLRAAAALDTVTHSGGTWGAEAGERAGRIRSSPARSLPSPQRREALVALLSASKPAEVAEAGKRIAALPAGITADLQQLHRKLSRLSPAELDEHGRLFGVYRGLRERAISGQLEPAEAEEFARFPRVSTDPVLWAPALQLAAFVHASRDDWRAAEKFVRSLAAACRVRGCVVEHEAIALDEAADAAAREGDYASARNLQSRAEALFTAAGAEQQLVELRIKRAQNLDEEGLHDDAAREIARVLDGLAHLDGFGTSRAVALTNATGIAAHRGQRRAARELAQAAIEVAREAGARDPAADAAAALAANSIDTGELSAAKALLEREIRALKDARHEAETAGLYEALANVLLRSNDAAGALAAAERGLAVVPSGAFAGTVGTQLSLVHAKALRAVGRNREAAGELDDALAVVLRSAEGAKDRLVVLERGTPLAAQRAALALSEGKPAEEVVLPLDRVRAAMVGAQPVKAGWARSLPAGTCVVVAEAGIVAVITRDGGEAVAAEQVDPAMVARRCPAGGDVWWLSSTEPAGIAVEGIATSLSRLLAPEPPPPASALLVSAPSVTGDVAGVAVALPHADRAKDTLSQLGMSVVDLRGPGATPDAVLAAASLQPLLHFAVHGFDGAEGGFLQLSGDPGRLSAADLAGVHLAGQRVVLAACETASPGPRGLAWAFARSGASAVVAARGRIDDAMAAAWSERFHRALTHGAPILRAAREAEADPRAPRFVVLK